MLDDIIGVIYDVDLRDDAAATALAQTSGPVDFEYANGWLTSISNYTPFHYHIHRFNWNKPWLWFRDTPIVR